MLQGKVCMVTGTRSGIGKAIALRFAEEGAVVFANAKKEEDVKAWSDLVRVRGKIIPLPFDVTDSVRVKKSLLQIREQYGHLDVQVNNAAVISYEPMGMIARRNLEEMFQVNVFAVFEMVQLASRMMRGQNKGSIINISSMVGEKGAAGQVAYSMTKGAVSSLTKSAAKELAKAHIRVNAVAPGMVGSERFECEMEKRFPEGKNNILWGRLAKPEEIADACLFLASDLSEYISGQVIGVDGCMVL